MPVAGSCEYNNEPSKESAPYSLVSELTRLAGGMARGHAGRQVVGRYDRRECCTCTGTKFQNGMN